jgi:hypothetical protein
MGAALFWVITQRVVAIHYRRFGTTNLDPRKGNPIDYPETSVRNYHYSLRNDPEEHSSRKYSHTENRTGLHPGEMKFETILKRWGIHISISASWREIIKKATLQ